MPELPDVVVLKRCFGSTSLHKTVRDLTLSSEDLRVKSSRSTFKKYLVNHRFEEIHHHGKYFFAGVDNGVSWSLVSE